MGIRFSSGISRDAPSGRRAAGHSAKSLCDVRNILGVPRVGVARLGYQPASTGEGSQACLNFLTAILDPVAKVQAKTIAIDLINEFGSLSAVLCANTYELRRIIGDNLALVEYIHLVRATNLHVLRSEFIKKPLISTSATLRDYLSSKMEHQSFEQFRVLFLDARNFLIKDEAISQGTIDEVAAYPREIVKRALELGASALILVHNHPSGDSQPSKSDINVTRTIVKICNHLRIVINDHIIVARGSQSSMRALGLI